MKRAWDQFGTFAPLLLMVGYLLTTYAVFLFGPLDWVIGNPLQLHGYAALGLLFLVSGYFVGVKRPLAQHSYPFPWRRFFWIGCTASIVLVAPSTLAYTGKWPWQAFNAVGCQSSAYLETLEMLRYDVPARKIVSLLRGLASPFIYAVIPLAILHYRELRHRDWLLLSLHVLGLISFSLLRGTDKETADLVIMLFAVGLLLFHGAFISRRLPLRHFAVFCAIVGCIGFASFSLFLERKEARMSVQCVDCGCDVEKKEGKLNSMPRSVQSMLPQSSLANAKRPGIHADSKAEFYASMVALYLGNGYYGLSLALKQPFTSCYGLGHSYLASHYVGRFVSPYFETCSYIDKIDAAGWSKYYFWATALTWIANDVGFSGALLVLLVFAFGLAVSWRVAITGQTVAFLVFAQLLLGIFYLPANNQLFISPDSYATLLFWLGYWLLLQYRPSNGMKRK